MAMIVATFDTKAKTLEITNEGKNIKNVSSVWFDVFEKEAHFELSTFTRDEDNDTRTVTRLMANEDGELVEKDDTNELREQMSRLLFPGN